MAKEYQVNGMVRLVNSMIVRMIRWNLAPPQNYVLTVQGRKSGKPYSMPVRLIIGDGKRWLVSPYGEVNWVKNARSAGEVSLSRGGKTEILTIHELSPQESAPILKEYVTRESIVRPYFDAQPESGLDAFAAEAPRHPVFLLEE
jgi:deazaflavin-dependent oxidoreductase (nitroreductase family)